MLEGLKWLEVESFALGIVVPEQCRVCCPEGGSVAKRSTLGGGIEKEGASPPTSQTCIF